MNWFKSFRSTPKPLLESVSILYDESTFYNKFKQDLREAKQEVIIESPFITSNRLNSLKPLFESLIMREVKIFIMTRSPKEQDESMSEQAEVGIRYFEEIGIQVLLCAGNHHRKLAIIDRKILWEGSLNILSQNKSREIMRRIEDEIITLEMFNFLKLYKFV